jgi:hypothetical protein
MSDARAWRKCLQVGRMTLFILMAVVSTVTSEFDPAEFVFMCGHIFNYEEKKIFF